MPKISFEDIPTRTPVREPQKCQQSSTSSSRPLTLQFRVVVSVVFKVFSQNRIQQRSPPSSSLTFQYMEEVFKVYAQYRVQQRPRHPQFLALQLIGSTLWMRRFKCFFRNFSSPSKSARVTRHSSARVPRSASSSDQMARAARPQDFSDDGNIYREDEEKIWVRLDTGQWKLLCTDIVVDQPWP